MPPSGGGGLSAPADRGKKGKGHRMVPFPPLDSPNPPSSRSAKHSRLNGGDGGSVPCVGQLMGRLSALRLLCVSCRAYQCAARRCRALALRCEKLRFHQALTLGAPNAPVGPSHLDARPEESRPKGKVGESRGAGKPWCPCPFVSAGRPRHSVSAGRPRHSVSAGRPRHSVSAGRARHSPPPDGGITPSAEGG